MKGPVQNRAQNGISLPVGGRLPTDVILHFARFPTKMVPGAGIALEDRARKPTVE